eukprot:CAMPEP_0114598154 /NCGR_PEP_ID=MMETSP0125-20121206/20491_1 /TAXON_ID=485358 ORGANISM="Aristerostoma sp., Strain ATCC 50986" /NCGR_SAMPLE_ID=MMETSP0125 /ASSEMBLY_ACC=CAM_ASM_000245 /LENGTH=127 /DNA_ID=CAMNT_0001803535 /DNA_START=339 /DNA_END=722 /DNA_ORIENTATION=-
MSLRRSNHFQNCPSQNLNPTQVPCMRAPPQQKEYSKLINPNDDTQKEQRFPIVNGIEILTALQYLNETGRLKHLKSNNDDENMVNEKISQIKKDERYAVLTDFSGKFFSNDSSQLKKDLQSLAYFQK